MDRARRVQLNLNALHCKLRAMCSFYIMYFCDSNIKILFFFSPSILAICPLPMYFILPSLDMYQLWKQRNKLISNSAIAWYRLPCHFWTDSKSSILHLKFEQTTKNPDSSRRRRALLSFPFSWICFFNLSIFHEVELLELRLQHILYPRWPKVKC